ncbi:cation transporter [Staphylococcus aureus]
MLKAIRIILHITGMTCAACSNNRIEKKLNKLDDVNAQVNLTTEKATVEDNPNQHDVQEFINTYSTFRLRCHCRNCRIRHYRYDLCCMLKPY